MRPAAPLLAGLLVLVACRDAKVEPTRRTRVDEVRIGAVLPLTGPQAQYGVATKAGIDLAIAQQNESGGLLGRNVRVFYVDDMASTERARAGAEKLVAKNKVAVIVGASASEPASAMAKVAVRAKIPMITPSATAPAVTKYGAFVFRICYVDPFQAMAMAKHARQQMKLTRVAVLRDLGHDYAVQLARAFEKSFVADGGRVVSSDGYLAEDADFDEVVQKVIDAKPEAIYLPGYYAQIERITTTARRLGYRGVFLGADGWDSRAIQRLEAADGSVYTTHFAGDDPTDAAKAFERAYVAAMNEAPDAMAALGYDAARFAMLAIQRAGSTDGLAVQRALADAPVYEGASGRIELDADRNAIKPAVVVKLKDGRAHFVGKVAPIRSSGVLEPDPR